MPVRLVGHGAPKELGAEAIQPQLDDRIMLLASDTLGGHQDHVDLSELTVVLGQLAQADVHAPIALTTLLDPLARSDVQSGTVLGNGLFGAFHLLVEALLLLGLRLGDGAVGTRLRAGTVRTAVSAVAGAGTPSSVSASANTVTTANGLRTFNSMDPNMGIPPFSSAEESCL